ncbi:hypothetical protein ACFPRL_04950 [Pseudoclavibacter helvolus]
MPDKPVERDPLVLLADPFDPLRLPAPRPVLTQHVAVEIRRQAGLVSEPDDLCDHPSRAGCDVNTWPIKELVREMVNEEVVGRGGVHELRVVGVVVRGNVVFRRPRQRPGAAVRGPETVGRDF